MKRFVLILLAIICWSSPGEAFTRGGYTTNIASGNCPQGTSFADGCTGAAATGVQTSSLLSSYGANRPPWNVPGVDYPVGLPTSVVLSDPVPSGTLASALTALGCTLNATGSVANSTIGCAGSSCNNQTFSGWDFGGFGHGGLRLELQCNNVHVTQNNFKTGTNTLPALHIQAGTNGCLIDYNTIDGAGIPTSDGSTGDIGGLVTINNFGTCTLQYNVIQNAYFQLIQKGGDASGSTTQTVQFSSLANAGTGHLPTATFTGAITSVSGGIGTLTISGISGTVGINSQVCTAGSCDAGLYVGYITAFVSGTGGNGTYTVGHATATASTSMAVGGAHGDQSQDITATGNVISAVNYKFSLYQQSGTNSTQGLSIFSAGNQTGGEYDAANVSNNTMIYGASSNSNDAIIMDNTWLNGSSIVNSNYIDITGLNSNWMFYGKLNSPDGPFNGTMSSCTGNKNMSTGATLTTTGGGVVTCN